MTHVLILKLGSFNPQANTWHVAQGDSEKVFVLQLLFIYDVTLLTVCTYSEYINVCVTALAFCSYIVLLVAKQNHPLITLGYL